MEIKNLAQTPLIDLIECLLEAFSDYFVKMPSDLVYWEDRLKGARVDYSLSYGMFNEDRLVGFIINGVDHHHGQLTAFNTGTGVLPEFRSGRVVDRLYQHALPHFQERGIKKCLLEVIQKNERAIRVYERIGFSKKREVKCFMGRINASARTPVLQKIPFEEICALNYPDDELYSWDNSRSAIEASGDVYTSWLVRDEMDRQVGYFTINIEIGYVARIYAEKEQYELVLNGIALLCRSVRLNNLDVTRSSLLAALEEAGLQNHVDQYEMEMPLKG